MIPNKLILRITDSPFVTPYEDINKNSVLTRKQLDGNFIYLKGETIYSAESTSNSVILKKLNGNDITVDLTNFTGSTSNQDNKFRFIELGNWMAGGRGLGEVDVEQAFISALNNGLNTTSLVVNDDELIIFKVSVTIYGSFNTEERKYYFKNLVGKGEYNPLSSVMSGDELELAYRETIFNNNETIETSPNVNIINLGTLPDANYLTYINTNGDLYDLTDSTKIHYFRFDYNGTDYIYVFDPNGSIYGYSVYGLGESQFDNLDLVLFYDSSAPQIIEEDDIFRGTYSELKYLADNSQLKIGRTYILTDYQTKYQINGTNSSTRQELHTMIGSSGAYTQFFFVPNTIAANGDIITCVYAPPGASITSGQTFTIIDYFNTAYIRLSPQVTASNNIGSIFKFEKQRYANIPTDITILDDYGKPVIKPNGVINTDVHDGTPYMLMSGIQNPTPIIEEIVLKAIDVNQFSRDAESLTFIGDKLIFDFNDNEIFDENDIKIGDRNGYILRRTNLEGNISIDKDWRVQRYRRYRIDDFNWNSFLHKKSFSENPLTSGSTIYNLGAVNMCTNNNPTLSLNHRFIISEPLINNVYIDFAKNVNDPFLSGTTSAPAITDGQRFNTSIESNTYMSNISLPLSGFSGTSCGFDFNIIPIDNYEASSMVTRAVVKVLSNSVFLPYSQRYGVSGNLFLESESGDIYNTTLCTLTTVVNKGTINRVISLDSMILRNYYEINNSVFLTNGAMTNFGFIKNSNFGSGYIGVGVNEYLEYIVDSGSNLVSSVFGGNRIDKLIFSDFNSTTSLIINKTVGLSTMSGKLFLTQYKNNNSTFGSEINLNTFSNQIPSKGAWGHVYNFNTPISDINVNNSIVNKSLIYESIDTGLTRTINVITTAL